MLSKILTLLGLLALYALNFFGGAFFIKSAVTNFKKNHLYMFGIDIMLTAITVLNIALIIF